MDHIFYDLRKGISNVFRWIPIIWLDRDWDWEHLNTILIYKFERMAKSIERGPAKDRTEKAKELRICAELCRRMGKDEYAENLEMFRPQRDTYWAKHWTMMAKQDQDMLGKLIGKYYMSWWD